MKGCDLELPAGFRFHPTDEELVMHYLCRKCASLSITVPIIADIDLYKFDPWLLPGMALYGEKEWYFFSPRDRKYPNGSRPNRAAGSGYWKATGADKPIGKPKPVGIKKALVFYAGKAPRGVKTNWIMHEYRLADVDRSPGHKKNHNNSKLDDWVLCRIYNKKGVIEKQFNADTKKTPSTTPATLSHPSMMSCSETDDYKPQILSTQGQNIHQTWPIQLSSPAPPPMMNEEFLYFDSNSDSVPKLHTDSSCSEHVTSTDLTCESREVQSQPRWKGDWEGKTDLSSSRSMLFNNNNNNMDYFAPQLDDSNQLSPLQDIFMYLQKPF